jgi:hypothetical protein
VELLKEQVSGCRKAGHAHDQVDLRTARIQQPGSEGRLRSLADAEVAGEAALGAEYVTRDSLEGSLTCGESWVDARAVSWRQTDAFAEAAWPAAADSAISASRP